ncbi:hypothetical protein C8Q74DRAFT_761021 [Fomes fomentarius]|nr:hypothetical protein C8Q74DRAFT_761021 [Fomes fomentarius]
MRRSLSSIVSPIKEHMSTSTFPTAPLPQGGIAPGVQEDADPFDDDRDRMRPTTPTFPDEDADDDEDVERTPLPSMFRIEYDEGRTPQPQVDDEAQDAEDAELGSEPPTPVPARPAMAKSLSAPSVRTLPPAFPEAKSNDELAPCQPAKSLPSSRLPKPKTVGRSKSMTTVKTALSASAPVSSAPLFTFAAPSRPLTSAGEQVATESAPIPPTQSVLSDSSKPNWRRGSGVAVGTKVSSTKFTDADTVRPNLAPSAKRAMVSATMFSDPALGGAARRPKTARGAKEAKEKEPPRMFGAPARPRSRSSINSISSNPLAPAPASKRADSEAGDVNCPSHIAKEHQDLDVLVSEIVNADAPEPLLRAFGQSTRVQTRVRPKGAR